MQVVAEALLELAVVQQELVEQVVVEQVDYLQQLELLEQRIQVEEVVVELQVL
jgi:hypothetical protein